MDENAEGLLMYLYCYARSQKARTTGASLLKMTEGEWINDCDSLISAISDTNGRADAAIVLMLPTEASVKLLLEKLYPADLKCPIFRMSPDGSFAEVLKAYGYNTYEILTRLCSAVGSRPLSSLEDRSDFAPDLMRTVKSYNMTPSSEDLLQKISEHIKAGGCVNLYSNIPLYMSEPILDTMSFAPFIFRPGQEREMEQAYRSAQASDDFSIFITCSELPEDTSEENRGKCLKLIPRTVVLGLEVTGRTDPEYAVRTVGKTLETHGIDRRSIATVAVTAIARENEAVAAIADDLGCFITAFDSRLLKAVRVPLTTYLENYGNDICTAAACGASDNGRLILRRGGEKNSVLLTAAMKRGSIVLTE